MPTVKVAGTIGLPAGKVKQIRRRAEQRLAQLLGTEEHASRRLRQATEELTWLRTAKLPRLLSRRASAEFLVLLGATGEVEQARFIQGDEALRGVQEALRAAKFDLTLPDNTAVKLVRHALVSCTETPAACVLVLIPVPARPPVP